MRSRRPAGRVVAALVSSLVVLLGLLGSFNGSAYAADPPLPGTIGGLTVTESGIEGLLTLRSGQQVVTVDPNVTARIGGRTVPVTITPADRTIRTAVLVIDTSGSMQASGMAIVRTAVQEFLASVPDDVKVGVVSFGTTAGAEIEPTTDRAAVQRAVDKLRSEGETALFSGVEKAVQMLGPTGDRSLILLSDGKNTVGPRDPGLAAAVAALQSAQVRAEVVRFNTGENDLPALEAFARVGGGSVAQANDPAAVRAAFASAAKILDSQAHFQITLPPGLSGESSLEITGTASGRPFTLSAPVQLVAAGSPPAPSTTAPSIEVAAPGAPAAMRTEWLLPVAMAVLFLALLALSLAVLLQPSRSGRRARVAAIADYSLVGARQQRHAAESHQRALTQSVVAFGDRVMKGRSTTSRTMLLINRADLPLRAGEWFILRMLALIACAVFGAALVRDASPLGVAAGAIVGAVVGLVLPAFVLRALAARRARKFEALLPDVMMLVATGLSSGFSLTQALDGIAKDSAEPAAKEFARALAETRIGTDISDALDHLAVRMNSESMRWTTMAIRIQREVGGNLADTLRTTATTLRERESLRRQVRSLSAEGRLSAYILIAMPIILLLYLTGTNREYVSLLWTTTPGLLMLAVSALGMVVGSIWMNKVVKIEV